MREQDTPVGLVFLSLVLLVVFSLGQGTTVAEGPSTDLSGGGADPTRLVGAMKEICPSGEIALSDEGVVRGCKVCPQGTAFENEHGDGFELQLRGATVGHFTSPQADNLLLSSGGCEPHSRSFGGTFVLVSEPEELRLLTYNPGLITDRCHQLRRSDGRDVLVCQTEWGGQGMVASYVYLVAFEPSGRSRVTPIFTTFDTVGTCGEDSEGNWLGPVVKSAVTGVGVRDLNGDGTPDLTLTVSLGRATPTAAEQQVCLSNQRRSESGGEGVPVTVKSYKIDFFFDGEAFKVTPESQVDLKLFPEPAPPPAAPPSPAPGEE